MASFACGSRSGIDEEGSGGDGRYVRFAKQRSGEGPVTYEGDPYDYRDADAVGGCLVRERWK